MPNYDYRCPVCGDTWTANVPVAQRDDVYCHCHAQGETPHRAVRLPAAPGVAFKGTGFYATDYKGKP